MKLIIQGRLLNNDDLKNPVMTTAFARKLARFHHVRVPINKRPPSMSDKIDILMRCVEKLTVELAPLPLPMDFNNERMWLQSVFSKLHSRRVLGHNDMNRTNCLIRDDKDDPFDKVVLLDYEFSSYSYRGKDIGGHFSSRMIDPLNSN